MTIKPFSILDETNAPTASQSALAEVKKDFGMIPNLEGVMASAPSLLEAYAQSWASFQKTSLTPIEQQVVYMTFNFENNCEYCIPWHTKLSVLAGLDNIDIENLRHGAALSNKRLNALHQFTKAMVRTHGSITPADLQGFFESGYTEQQALEVVLGIAIKTMSNYTNAIAQTPLDKVVKQYSWEKPSLREKLAPN